MQRNQLVFFGIILLAVAIIGIGFGIQALAGLSGDDSNDQPTPINPTVANPITLEVAVTPLLETWVSTAATAYNQTNPKVNGRVVTVHVTPQDSLPVWGDGQGSWSPQSHPTVWIPEVNFALTYAKEGFRLAYEPYKASLVETPIIWGGYKSRTDVLGTLDAQTVQAAALIANWEAIGGNTRWGFIKLAMSRPNTTGSGLASFLTLIANLQNTPTLTSAMMSDVALQEQLKPVIDAVPNFSTLGIDPALAMSTRGTSSAEIGLMPEQQWLLHWDDLNGVETVELFYPAHHVLLDFPYAIWSGAETTADDRKAAQAFGDFLFTDAQQTAAGELGFRPVNRLDDLAQFSPFIAAQNSVQLTLTGTEISPADRPATLALLRWFGNYRTAP